MLTTFPEGIEVRADPTRPSPPSQFRQDIQGLRAIAVLIVVLNHLLGWPSGGFVGVDVFYVLSGYLITGLLLKEYRETGWISFRGFYARRIRRILPAAVLVLVATVAVAYLLWYAPRADQTLLDALAALFFVENWHLIRVGTDYLQARGPVSPVQQYWSLSVEEQFYVVWPWLILLVAGLASRRRKDVSQRFMASAIGAVIVVSFVWCVLVSHAYPNQGYFETVSRVWELAAGALLASVPALSASIGRRAGRVLTWAGLGLLVAATTLITPELSFPGPWAALPVLATTMIILGGSSGHQNRALSHPVASYIGDISYSLYLWHFPVIVFTLTVVERSPASIAFMVAAMAALSTLTYHFVEDPIRRSSWLRSWSRPLPRRNSQLVGAAVVAVGMIGCLAIQLLGPSSVINAATRRTPASAGSAVARDWSDPAVLSAEIVEAAQATAWPAGLHPSFETLSTADGAPAMDDVTGCRNNLDHVGRLHYCDRPGSGADARTVLVVGDSVAMSWMPAVETALPAWRVLGLGFANCPAVPVAVAASTSGCTRAQEEMRRYAAEVRPDVIVTASSQGVLTNLASGATGADAQQEWSQATSRFVAAHPASKVYVLGNPPQLQDQSTCLTRLAAPHDCDAALDEQFALKMQAEESAVVAGGATFVNTRDWFCTQEGTCPAMIDGVVLRVDRSHLTDAAARSYGSRLATSLAAI
jgi:peptidoglycan/LPS O-acetylase OafA/YrhL